MGRRKRKLTRIQKIKRQGILILCTALAAAILTYHYRPDLFAAMGLVGAGPEEGLPDASPGPETPDPEGSPQLDAPEPEDGHPQLDAPMPEEPPVKKDSLELVDGNSLFARVTKQTTLGRYAPGDLVLIPAEIVHPDRRGGEYYLRREPLEHLQQMWAAAAGEGVQLTVTSAYRSYDTQVDTFNYWVSIDGEARANTYSARPGQSEHQLGTTLDFNISLTEGAEQHAWLAQKAQIYGFAMSYPEGAQEITGYKYEPWHYRYIGVEAAKEWKAAGQPLCVFLEQKQ